MNLAGDGKNVVTSVVMDASTPETDQQANNDDDDDLNEGVTCELAKLIASKLARKTGLPQVFLSLNLAEVEVIKLQSDFKTLTNLTGQICDLIAQLQ